MAKTYHHGDLKTAAIKKTVEIIQKKGEADFTLREIAQSLKVSHTAVYRHFKSKQDLLSHIAEEGFNNLIAAFENSTAGLRSPRQRLTALGRTYIEFALSHSGHYRAMFHQELRCAKDQRAELEAAGYKAFAILADCLHDGMKSQIFKKSNPEEAGRSVWSGIHGFSVLMIDGQFQSLTNKAALNEAIDGHLVFLERALLK
ncbi:TetR/AcrR family transcriptional regulator [Bdellovibrio bacteriovorus]|uniref:TetR family transcriptional regulator n=1 Tax=Bdellovibrio bacteriovorus TaxID=959 RepID=A0A1Z3N449_BDEBC|nr:TetR/AcrR family transcriptional regulator [Bdellovibrio bacteriovorus]ASD62253.1 TetR family transcriptional regulator [Bdellovibrio bacteriovorus]